LHIPTQEQITPLFRLLAPGTGALHDANARLLRLKAEGDFMAFMELAVRLRKTIVVSGQTGAGKTFVLKYLCSLCDPRERLVTIESVRELMLLHANAVHLLYTDNEQGKTQVSPRQLLKAALRLRPDRILLAEVRDEECLFFLRAAASGHPGSMTTLHAGTCEEAFAQMALMIRQGPGGAGLPLQEIDRLLRMTVDVVVQFGNDPTEGRFISEVYFDPARRQRAATQGVVA
jgi:type IV secretion system protein VirB11